MLIDEVNVIFHCAATVRFDEPLSVATQLNVRCVRDLLVMAKQMKQLRVGIFEFLSLSNLFQSHFFFELCDFHKINHGWNKKNVY